MDEDGTLFIDKLTDDEIKEMLSDLIKLGGIQCFYTPSDTPTKEKDCQQLTNKEIKIVLAVGDSGDWVKRRRIRLKCAEEKCDSRDCLYGGNWNYREIVEHWIRKHGNIKPWKDPESLFCDTEFLKKFFGKEPVKGSECHG